ncbi:hypothetical protein CS0771_65120 [Catellatospora sp. IY07-71]|uniref:hypothetical protein n=1 Tax=Catellatospora sp. IY07-71 TaxID=2728827 RepID=UPI001BB3A818|nr:hypothetical protein [Catellatospora sp. IY07-71]BCJ76968.1 hypothetical protein CS0771_65120 [Catellatospora sp. IY07-71]
MARDQQDPLPFLVEMPDPPGDEGAVTQAQFRYQAEVIARWCFRLFDADGPIAIVCEDHEDFHVVHRDIRTIDLISVKHRGRNPWPLGELCIDGGLAHLFDRWSTLRAAGRIPRAAHVSNAGLGTGVRSPSLLQDMISASNRDDEQWLTWSKILSRQFLIAARQKELPTLPDREPPQRPEQMSDDDGLVLDVADFLRVLTFVTAPHMGDLAATNIVEVVTPLFQRWGWDTRDAQPSHASVCAMVEQRSRSLGGRKLDLVRNLGVSATWPIGISREHRLRERMIDADSVRAALVRGGEIPLFHHDLEMLPAPGGADLRRKMSQGRLSVTQHQLAERLRTAWYNVRKRALPDLIGDAAAVAQIEAEVLEQVIDAQDAAASSGDEYGGALFQQLRERVAASSFRSRPPIRINDQHALGVAFELSDQCDFDFLPPATVAEDSP